MIDLLFHLVHPIYSYFENKRLDAHDRAFAMGLKLRTLLHADIPDLDNVRVTFGERFLELQKLFIEHDPADLHTRRSRSGGDLKHADLVGRRYAFLTRTALYRMRDVEDYSRLKQILRTELGLWFGTRAYPTLDENDPEALLPTIHRWRQRWAHR